MLTFSFLPFSGRYNSVCHLLEARSVRDEGLRDATRVGGNWGFVQRPLLFLIKVQYYTISTSSKSMLTHLAKFVLPVPPMCLSVVYQSHLWYMVFISQLQRSRKEGRLSEHCETVLRSCGQEVYLNCSSLWQVCRGYCNLHSKDLGMHGRFTAGIELPSPTQPRPDPRRMSKTPTSSASRKDRRRFKSKGTEEYVQRYSHPNQHLARAKVVRPSWVSRPGLHRKLERIGFFKRNAWNNWSTGLLSLAFISVQR